MKKDHVGGRLETVTLRVAAAASLLITVVTVVACGGKVIGDDPAHGCAPVTEPATTSTSSPVASSSPTGEPSSSAPPTSTATPPVLPTDAGAPVIDSGVSPTGVTLDGGVFNDGEPGSLVAVARTACTVPAAVSALALPDGGLPPVTSLGRELAVCESPAGEVDCASNDGVQCSNTASVVLLYDSSCVDGCAAGEYVFGIERVDLIAYPEPPELVAAPCREAPFDLGGGGNDRTYCCPCGD